jgi:hypothetical protein
VKNEFKASNLFYNFMTRLGFHNFIPTIGLHLYRFSSHQKSNSYLRPIPIYVGIGWLAVLNLVHQYQRKKIINTEDGSRGIVATVEGIII